MPISKTAFGVAYHRYIHLVLDGNPKILDDHIVGNFLSPEMKEKITINRDLWFTPSALGLRSNVLVRSRFAEDLAEKAIAKGISTIVILGAGLDTCSLRMGLRHPGVRFIEIDQKDTQESKISLLAKNGIAIPPNVTFLAIDFETSDLEESLAKLGIQKSTKVFFSWLGVTMYLTREAILKTLNFCSSLAAGTTIVFTFANSATFASEIESRANALGEIWLSKFSEEEAEELLRESGFSWAKVIPPNELEKSYFEGRSDMIRSPKRAFLAVGTT